MGIDIISTTLLIIAFIGFVISAGFITDSSRRITNIPDYSSNKDLETAHKYSAICAVVSWIVVALMLVAIVLLFIFASEVLVGYSKIFIYGFLLLSILGAGVVAILSILTAVYINRAKVSDNKGAYRQSIIAAVLASVVFVFVIAALLFRMFYKPKPKKEKVDTEITELKMELGEPETNSES